jgi:hypothetical protein
MRDARIRVNCMRRRYRSQDSDFPVIDYICKSIIELSFTRHSGVENLKPQLTIKDIIHRLPFCCKHSVSEIEFCLRLQVEPAQLGLSVVHNRTKTPEFRNSTVKCNSGIGEMSVGCYANVTVKINC